MKHKLDTILLAFSLFCISGAMLVYNLRAGEGSTLGTLPSEKRERSEAIAVIAPLYSEDTAKAETTETDITDSELLPPVIRAGE